MARRVYCVGPGDAPCPAHAWWFYEGKGRPRERCPVCWRIHEANRRRENWRNDFAKRRQFGTWTRPPAAGVG